MGVCGKQLLLITLCALQQLSLSVALGWQWERLGVELQYLGLCWWLQCKLVDAVMVSA